LAGRDGLANLGAPTFSVSFAEQNVVRLMKNRRCSAFRFHESFNHCPAESSPFGDGRHTDRDVVAHEIKYMPLKG
jgi:hypothetical protein